MSDKSGRPDGSDQSDGSDKSDESEGGEAGRGRLWPGERRGCRSRSIMQIWGIVWVMGRIVATVACAG